MEVTLPIDVLGKEVVVFFTKNVENFLRRFSLKCNSTNLEFFFGFFFNSLNITKIDPKIPDSLSIHLMPTWQTFERVSLHQIRVDKKSLINSKRPQGPFGCIQRSSHGNSKSCFFRWAWGFFLSILWSRWWIANGH